MLEFGKVDTAVVIIIISGLFHALPNTTDFSSERYQVNSWILDTQLDKTELDPGIYTF